MKYRIAHLAISIAWSIIAAAERRPLNLCFWLLLTVGWITIINIKSKEEL